MAGLIWSRPAIRHAPHLSIHPPQLVADGYDTATLTIDSPSSTPPRISFPENSHSAAIQEVVFRANVWEAQIRAGIVPGRILVRVESPNLPPATVALTATPYYADSADDGTPDVLRLDDEHDRRAFRNWFTFLAEAQYFEQAEARPAEIVDCAALIRYSYREALRAHDSRWAAESRLPVLPALASASKYQYPFTPLGAALFRVHEGPFQTSDISSGSFAQFADVQTLLKFNSHRVSRNLERALPGDLLFFRQDAEHMPFHSMIYLGQSRITSLITSGAARYVVYHTGPDGEDPGIIRRLTTEELLHYPEPQWRPLESNPAFLGVYRWNILREAQ